MKLCSVPGCQKMHKSKSLCEMHYTRWRRSGRVGFKWFVDQQAMRDAHIRIKTEKEVDDWLKTATPFKQDEKTEQKNINQKIR